MRYHCQYQHQPRNTTSRRSRRQFFAAVPVVASVWACLLLLLLSPHQQSFCHANPATGNFTLLVVLVQFEDHVGRRLPEQTYFQDLCENELAPYLLQQSYGKYHIDTCQVLDWSFTNGTEAEFAAGIANGHGPEGSARFATYILDILTQLNRLDWDDLDRDQDGLLDAVLFLHSGYAAEYGAQYGRFSSDGCGTNPPADRFQNVGGPESVNAWSNDDAGVRLNGYAIASAMGPLCTNEPATMGIMTHELLHTLGAIDLYDPNQEYGGLGIWDIMSWGINNNLGFGMGQSVGQFPGSLSPYNKLLLGWIEEPISIEYDGVYEISASNRESQIYIISERYPPGEFLLIENRQLLDFDAQLPGNGGLLIYKVDEAMDLDQTAPGYPGLPGWPLTHYRISLLQADGSYHLEKGINAGDNGDAYSRNSQELLPGSSGFVPNTDSYQFGEWSETGIAITDISDSQYTMTFRVSGLGAAPTTPAPTALAPTLEPTTGAPVEPSAPQENDTLPPTPNPTPLEPTSLAPVTLAPVSQPSAQQQEGVTTDQKSAATTTASYYIRTQQQPILLCCLLLTVWVLERHI